MRRFAISLLLMLLLPMPAAAQIAGRIPREPVRAPDPFVRDSRLPGPAIWREVHDIRDKIDRRRDSGSLSRREARQLDREARHIGRLARRYGRDGISESERRELENRSLYLRGAVNRPEGSKLPGSR